MAKMGRVVWFDGEWVSQAEAQVPVMTHSLHYGLSVFEGIRCYDGEDGPAIFRLPEHAKRHIDSGKIMGMPLGLEAGALAEAIRETVARNEHRSCYIRPLSFYTAGTLGLSTRGAKTSTVIVTWEWGAYLGEDGLDRGIKCTVSSFTRHHPNVMMTKAKVGGNYVNSQLAKADAISGGYDEALMLDPEGYVVEGTGENLFIVEAGCLITPPKDSILPGITRATIIELAAEQGISVSEERIPRDRLLVADEVFLTGTAAEVTPVREIDRRDIGAGSAGPVTKLLQGLYFDAVHGRLKDHESWLSPVATPSSVKASD